MIKLEPLEDYLRTIFMSGYLKNVKPLSTLLVANVEGGKTELVKEFALENKNKGLLYLNDCTAYGIIKKYLPKIESGQIHHVVLPDLITPLSKGKSTRNSFIAFLNGLIEEGIVEIQHYAIQMKCNANCGLVACIAKKELYDKRAKWANMGFMSRMLPLSWDYNRTILVEILESIINEEYTKPKRIEISHYQKKKEIKGNAEVNRKLAYFAQDIANAENLYGFRLQKQLQTLVKASALDRLGFRKAKEVGWEDYERFLKFADYINLNFKKI